MTIGLVLAGMENSGLSHPDCGSMRTSGPKAPLITVSTGYASALSTSKANHDFSVFGVASHFKDRVMTLLPLTNPRVITDGGFAGGVIRRGVLWPLARIRYQLAGGLVIAVLVPALLRARFELNMAGGSLENTVLGTTAAMIVGAYILRRLLPFPGVQGNAFVLPAFAATYAATLLLFFFLRIDYSRFQFVASFFAAVPWFVAVSIFESKYKRPLLAVIPAGNANNLLRLPQADWCTLRHPEPLPARVSGLVADLRADLPAEWEKFIATCALRGVPVYHSKQISESLTGQVDIEHLSENSLGSLIPSSVYVKLKGSIDALVALVTIPLLVPFALVIAFLVKREDGGPILFYQQRMGYRGRIFTMLKFRTMRDRVEEGKQFTVGDDPRVTKIGRHLRRFRLDEIPQIINILKGEMSWIGPRPEALSLSSWYERKIPFYSYRHIVKPGISGWAQVQQGYAAEIVAVTDKLHFDFFYIKHFSPWLDILIVARTIRTIYSGFGSR